MQPIHIIIVFEFQAISAVFPWKHSYEKSRDVGGLDGDGQGAGVQICLWQHPCWLPER